MTTCRLPQTAHWPNATPTLAGAAFVVWPVSPLAWQLALYRWAYEQATAATQGAARWPLPEPCWN